MRRRSIRFRFLAWFGFLLAALIVGFGITAYHLQRNATFDRIDAELERQVDLLSVAFRGVDVGAHFPHGDRGGHGRIRGERPPEPPPGLAGNIIFMATAARAGSGRLPTAASAARDFKKVSRRMPVSLFIGCNNERSR